MKEILNQIGAEAERLGLKAWAVGGLVRDEYLGINDTLDIDITVEGEADALAHFAAKKWHGKLEQFLRYGTFRVALKNGINLDFVRARKEIYPHPASLPVVSPGTLGEDLFRRDFTANAWAKSILPSNYARSFDPYGAQKDIDKKQIKILHAKSFLDDPTRMWRAVRFAGRFGWQIETSTEKLLKEAVQREYGALLTWPRLRQEFIKILQEEQFERIFKLMDAYGLSRFINKDLKWTPALEKAKNTVERAGVLGIMLGRKFVEDLQLRKEMFNEIAYALEVYGDKKSPLKKMSAAQKNIILAVEPGLPAHALEECFAAGGEIEELGFKGPEISSVTARIRERQWQGKITSKEEAFSSENLTK